MQRKGFTLIELIFVIVVIGILAAIAVPKFKNLKDNAYVSNIVAAYTNAVQNAPTSYLNETELNGLSDGDVNITSFFKVNYNCPSTGVRRNCWRYVSQDVVQYFADQSKYIQFYYRNNGTMTITTVIRGTNKDLYQQKITKQLGLTFNNDQNVTTLDLRE